MLKCKLKKDERQMQIVQGIFEKLISELIPTVYYATILNSQAI